MNDTIEQAIGREIRRRREAAGVSQSAVAAACRLYGAPWTRATIAAIELGRKRLTLGEVALLLLALNEADVTEGLQLTLHDLIPATEQPVAVGPGLVLPLRGARGVLLERGGDQAAASAPKKPVVGGVGRRAIEAAGDAEQKAAATLGVSPEAVVEAARTLWRESLTARRERLVGARAGSALPEDDPRALQARRGHATRALLKELRAELKGGGTSKKRRPR